jgi:hypothetical protein
MAELRQLGLIGTANSKRVRWSNGVEFVIQGGDESIVIGDQYVKLITTPANIGGTQQWLSCRECGTKRRRLWYHDCLWACQDCHCVATPGQLLHPEARAQRELVKYAERSTLPAWRLKRSAHRIPKLIEKLKEMK